MSPADACGAEAVDQVSPLDERRRQPARVPSQMVKREPYETGIGRMDEVTAARKPVLRWKAA
jgi:hypothetical protein